VILLPVYWRRVATGNEEKNSRGHGRTRRRKRKIK